VERERLIALEGAVNFRDLGGYPAEGGMRTRWRVLFRADGLGDLTEADLEVLRSLGIRTVVDLRSGDELERGRYDVDAHPVAFHHFPIIERLPDPEEFDRRPGLLGSQYQEMLRDAGPQIVAALEVLAAPDALPAVFHCSAGKDRTGIMAGILLRLLGVSVADVVEDYAISDAAMRRMLSTSVVRSKEAAEVLARYPSAMLGADPGNMARFLERIETQHGSMAAFVASIGVERVVVERLRTSLLEG
jgi:protein-tyrosine phosphatase